MFDLKSYLDDKIKIVNFTLENILNSSSDSSRLLEAMNYSLMGSGKRLRPVLCIATAQAIGCEINKDLLNTACALEMIHTYSLIHDDLPAMDDDEYRRGKLTCHRAFDEATAILTGDALLTLAFETLSIFKNENYDKKDFENKLLIIKEIAKASGNKGMIYGQMNDILSEGKELTIQEIEKIHISKTGALIKASVLSGAIIAKANKSQIKSLSIYAHNIGLAFQVTDDILNITGDPEIMGKSTGTDNKRNKSTYPLLVGVESAKKLSHTFIDNALCSINEFGKNALPLCAIAKYIINRKK